MHCSVLQHSLTVVVCSAEAMYDKHSDTCCVHHATGRGPLPNPPHPPPLTPHPSCCVAIQTCCTCMAVMLLPLWAPVDTCWRLVGLNTAGWYVWPECGHVQVMAAAQASPDSVLSVRASHLHLVTGPALHTPCAHETHTPGHATHSALQEVCLLVTTS